MSNRWERRREELFEACLKLPENHSIFLFTTELTEAQGAKMRARSAGNIRFFCMRDADYFPSEDDAEKAGSTEGGGSRKGRRRRSRYGSAVTYLMPGTEAETLESIDWK